MGSGSFENNVTNKLFVCKSYVFDKNKYKQDLALNNLQGLIFYITKLNKQLKNHMFTIPVNTFFESPAVNISMEVSLLEKPN